MYSIGQAAELLKVHSQTLRNWEKQGLIQPKRFGHARVYEEEDLERCRLIKKYSGRGIHLKGIKDIIQLNKSLKDQRGGEAA